MIKTKALGSTEGFIYWAKFLKLCGGESNLFSSINRFRVFGQVTDSMNH